MKGYDWQLAMRKTLAYCLIKILNLTKKSVQKANKMLGIKTL
jgi:hypothetical protein